MRGIRLRLIIVMIANLVLGILLVIGLSARAPGAGRVLTLGELAPLVNPGALHFVSPAGSILVARPSPAGEPGSWVVSLGDQVLPADAAKVENFLNSYNEATVLRVVTDNPALHQAFELGDETPYRIVIEGSGQTRELLLGKPGDQGDDLYVRYSGSDRVYLVTGGLIYYTWQDLAYWSDSRG